MNPKNSINPTLYDVAREAGVSKSTVALVVKNHPSVAPATRERVLKTIDSLHYVPNSAASLLGSARHHHTASEKKFSIAYISVCDHPPEKGPFWKSCRREIQALGYGAEAYNLDATHDAKALSRELYARGFAGIIIGTVSFQNILADFDFSPFAVVQCGRGPIPIHCHVVRHQTGEFVVEAWGRLVARGYRRIGGMVYMHTPANNDDLDRIGAVAACQECMQPASYARIPPLKCNHADLPSKAAWFKKHRPDVVMSILNWDYSLLMDMGCKVPKEIGFVSLATDDKSSEVTGFMPNIDDAARRAVHWCDQLIRAREFGIPAISHELVIAAPWHEGTTLRRMDGQPHGGRGGRDRPMN
jgi:DNA-binding LacI/PurR family transcriptional regulator